MENLQKYLIPRKIDMVGRVYRISEQYVAKINRSYENRRLEKELEFCRELFLNGISVPCPVGIFPITWFGLKSTPGFVMEYVKGKTGFKLKKEKNPNIPNVEKLLSLEIDKSMNI